MSLYFLVHKVEYFLLFFLCKSEKSMKNNANQTRAIEIKAIRIPRPIPTHCLPQIRIDIRLAITLKMSRRRRQRPISAAKQRRVYKQTYERDGDTHRSLFYIAFYRQTAIKPADKDKPPKRHQIREETTSSPNIRPRGKYYQTIKCQRAAFAFYLWRVLQTAENALC
jgi:hypothetical protein